jgi:hypothetical protein
MPAVALPSGRPTDGPRRDAHHRERGARDLREAGIKLGTPSRTVFVDRVREAAGGDASVMPLVTPLLAILAAMLREFARLTKQVLDIVREEKVCRPDERSWRRADHGAGFSGDDRPAGSIPALVRRGRASRSHAGTVSIG